MHLNLLKDNQIQFPHSFICFARQHWQLPERKHHVQNQRNQALFPFSCPDVFKMSSTTFLPWLCQPKPSHKSTSFQFSFLGLFIKIDFFSFLFFFFFTRLHSLLAQMFPLAVPLGCLFKSVSTKLFPALPLHLLKLPLLHLVAGIHPKYAEV